MPLAWDSAANAASAAAVATETAFCAAVLGPLFLGGALGFGAAFLFALFFAVGATGIVVGNPVTDGGVNASGKDIPHAAIADAKDVAIGAPVPNEESSLAARPASTAGEVVENPGLPLILINVASPAETAAPSIALSGFEINMLAGMGAVRAAGVLGADTPEVNARLGAGSG
jgi:hypothetical protein